ncbi:peptide chain release factor N(5)-glutamine methyltransferase [uncultured Ruminobacter sp.]|jgi:release factor glutamine methyltransferase|uniref:peptide chain release factor N(5)-glutamine methyltransferase n=1 Tax=Ruminobacter sp. TaxID=2774296 RepID=UPI0025FE0A11|nr:peptide chain release factor N(5)-glutamine methyltransferase [uncultured Ruminobacter sp.]
MQIGTVYKESWQKLNEFLQDREVSSIEAYFIVSEVLKKNKTFLLTYPEHEISDEEYAKIQTILAERISGRPLAHILGKREFWSLNLKVNEHTLIPRPDTETLVEQALLCAQKFSPDIKLRILDLGTGTGAVALALKSELPGAIVDAVDYSEEALKVAEFNSQNLNLPINLINSDWFEKIKARHQYHIIVSNPPYIAENDPHLNQGDVRFEPRTALVAPMQGLYDILNIIRHSCDYLANNGYLLLEHGYQQAGDVKLLMNYGGFTQVETVKDLGYNDRVTLGCFNYKDK